MAPDTRRPPYPEPAPGFTSVEAGRPGIEYQERESASEETPLLSGSPSGAQSSSVENGHPHLRANATPDEDEPITPVGPLRAFVVGLSLWILIFIQATNMSGMVVIQGAIAHDINAYDKVMWFTSAYLISMSALGPLGGRLASIFSPRVLVLPIAVFVALGSLVSAYAGNFQVFTLGRVITGLGGAGVLSLGVILVLDMTSKKQRGFVLGLVNGSLSLGVSFGGILFGALLPVLGWRPLFAIQTPLSLVSGAVLYLSIPPHPAESSTKSGSATVWQKLARLDYLGASLLTITIVAFLYALAGDIEPLILLLSLGTLLLFLAVEYLVASDPIIPLKVLSSRATLLSCLSQLGLLSARWTILFYTPIFMLAVHGQSRARAGSILLPTNIGFALGGVLVGYLHIRRHASYWLSCLVSIALFTLLMWALSLCTYPDSSTAAIIAIVLGSGLVTGAAINYTLAHLLHHSHDGTSYITTSLLGTFRGFGGAFGTAIGGGIFNRVLRSRLTEGFRSVDGGGGSLTPAQRWLIEQLLGAPELVYGSGLSPEDRAVAIDSYASAIRVVFQAATVLGVIVLVFQAGTGWTAPEREDEREDEQVEARVAVMENEGVGEV
ncbi:unnamed protein product [Clonostachys rhizophaga]|uniref:Major facilitator superfamily (MFS) profile domain-containing protein n=1 Tax=Clonostachys rhizophaga TaxID=160324 RepID=A0A9N9VNF6_9HYPO|nr:unnamed protein product [Clonostachys rhizophaga]